MASTNSERTPPLPNSTSANSNINDAHLDYLISANMSLWWEVSPSPVSSIDNAPITTKQIKKAVFINFNIYICYMKKTTIILFSKKK